MQSQRSSLSASAHAGDETIPSPRDRLRRETRAEHEALDALFAQMLEPGAAALYERFLSMNLAAHRAIEPLLIGSALAETEPNWQAGHRLEALEEDARALDLAVRPNPPFPIADPDLPQAFGMAYVLEGSRLGAKFLLKGLARAPAQNRPVGYLQASSDPEPFRRLLAALDREALSPPDIDRMVDAANRTFQYFRALTEGAAPRTELS